MSRYSKRSQNPIGPPNPLHLMHKNKKVTEASPSLVKASYMRLSERKEGINPSSRGLNEHQKLLLLTLQSQQNSQKKAQRAIDESKSSEALGMNANNVPPVTDELGKVDSSADAIKKPVEDANVSKSVIIGEEERKSVVEDDVMIKVETGKMTEKPISGYSGLKELNNVSDRPKLVSSFSRRASISTSTLQSTSTPHQEQHQQQQLQLQQVPVKAQAKTKKQKAEKGEGIGTILSMSPTHLISVAARIRRQSARWLALSATFWYLVIMDSSRVTTTESVEKLFEVLKWRATGKITSDEFSAIMTEWKRETVMELEESVMPSPRKPNFLTVPHALASL